MTIDPKDFKTLLSLLVPLIDKAIVAAPTWVRIGWTFVKPFLSSEAGAQAMHAAATSPTP